MTVYRLVDGVSAVQTLPPQAGGTVPGSNLPAGSSFADLHIGGALGAVLPASVQAFQLTVTGGSCSATAQLLGSNDGITWTNIGSLAAATANSPNVQTGSGTVAWAFFSAYISAISAGAKAVVLMNA